MTTLTKSLVYVATALLGLVPPLCCACSYADPPQFERIAPKAKAILAFRVLSLEVQEGVKTLNGGVKEINARVQGRIQVEAAIKGEAARFTHVNFSNYLCGGVTLQIGHRYLAATEQAGPILYLSPGDKSIGDIEVYFEYPLPPIEENRYVRAARDAVQGRRSFAKVLDLDAMAVMGPVIGIAVPTADIKK
jgi:hypothetical protein